MYVPETDAASQILSNNSSFIASFVPAGVNGGLGIQYVVYLLACSGDALDVGELGRCLAQAEGPNED